MTLAQAQAELALISGTITAVLTRGVQSYEQRGGGASNALTALPLKDLYARQRDLSFLVDRLQNGMVNVAQMRDPE